MSKNNRGNNGTIALVAISAVAIALIVWAIVATGNNKGASSGSGAEAQSKTISDIKLVGVNAKDQIKGNKEAKVTLIEYSDFQCPYCVRLHPVMEKVIDKYSDKARWVYRHYPLNFHKNAKAAAEAAEAAGEQGKFWEFSTKIAKNSQQDGTGLNRVDLEKYAEELNLDITKFKDALDQGKFREKVEADYNSGVEAGVEGTPSVFMIDKNGKVSKLERLDEASIIAKIEAASKE